MMPERRRGRKGTCTCISERLEYETQYMVETKEVKRNKVMTDKKCSEGNLTCDLHTIEEFQMSVHV